MHETRAGHDPERQLLARLCAMGPGWHSLLLRLHEQLLVVEPGYEVENLKEKFGAARVHLSTSPIPPCSETRALVAAAEEQSASTCEFCGLPGRRRTRGDMEHGWIKAVCDHCHAVWSHHAIMIINGAVHSRQPGPG